MRHWCRDAALREPLEKVSKIQRCRALGAALCLSLAAASVSGCSRSTVAGCSPVTIPPNCSSPSTFESLSLEISPIDPGSQVDTPGACHAEAPTGHFEHALIIVLENQDYDQAKPCFDKLIKLYKGVSFGNFWGLFHHSYPNYLAMVGGQQFSEIHRCYSDHLVTLPADDQHRSIADSLPTPLTWKNYAEGYSSGCRYAERHVPFLSFVSVTENPQNLQNVVDAQEFLRDAAGPNFPNYAFYSPDRYNDGHDTCMSFACDWVTRFLAMFPRERWRDTVVIVTFDEASGSDRYNNHIATVFLGDLVKDGVVVYQPYNHYNVLRTIEDNFGLAPLANNDCRAVPITGIWTKGDPDR